MGSRASDALEHSLSFEAGLKEGGTVTSISGGSSLKYYGEGFPPPIFTLELAVTDWGFDSSKREATIEVKELRGLVVSENDGIRSQRKTFATTLHLEYDGQRFHLYQVRLTIDEKETLGSRVIKDDVLGPQNVLERLEVDTLAPVKVMVGNLF